MGSDVDVKFILFLDCSDDNIRARVRGRVAHALKKGRPVRSDDNEEALMIRSKTFYE